VTTRPDVRESLEPLVAALREHAATMAAGGSSNAVKMAAVNRVRAAAEGYVDAVFEATGWGNVFADLFNDDTDDDADDAEDGTDEPPARDGRLLLTVRARYDYAVPDPAALMRAGQQARARGWEANPHGVSEVTHVGEAIYELLHHSPATLAALAIPELEPGSGLVTVQSTAAPLSPRDLEDADPGADLDELFLAGDGEVLYLLTEPMYASHEEAGPAVRSHADLEQ
jgi:hypothetical protein